MRRLPQPMWRKLVRDYLRRDQVALGPSGWQQIDALVTAAVRDCSITRQMLRVYNPGGPALESATGGGLNLSMVHWDFVLNSRTTANVFMGQPDIDPETVIGAARLCALALDNFIINGHPALGLPGLLGAPGRAGFSRHRGAGCAGLSAGIERAAGCLAAAGHVGPYALVINPHLYRRLTSSVQADPVAQGEIRDRCPAGVFTSATVPAGRILMLDNDPRCIDLAVAQGLTTAFLGAAPSGGFSFRIFEILALRIKEPTAICTAEIRGH